MWERDGSTIRWVFERCEGALAIEFMVTGAGDVSLAAWDEEVVRGEGTREISLSCGQVGDHERARAVISTALEYVSNGSAYDEPPDALVVAAITAATRMTR